MSEANKAVVRRYIEEIGNKGNLALADEIFSADSMWQGPNFQELRGREARKQHFVSLRRAFPDFRLTVDELITEGEKVAMRWSMRGTHRGEWQGVAPTGKPISIGGTSTYRIADGMITEEFMHWDALGFMQHIGAVPASTEANKALVRRFEEIFNQGNLILLDEVFSADSIYHGPNLPQMRGREAIKEHLASLRRAFPDCHYTVDDLVAEGNMVVVRWSLTGTHRGEFWGITPTGKKVSLSGTSTDRIADGMITEVAQQWDALGFMQQLGVVPALGQSAAGGR
jgi:steroid delta-isomerase-like uncharacterized protein